MVRVEVPKVMLDVVDLLKCELVDQAGAKVGFKCVKVDRCAEVVLELDNGRIVVLLKS